MSKDASPSTTLHLESSDHSHESHTHTLALSTTPTNISRFLRKLSSGTRRTRTVHSNLSSTSMQSAATSTDSLRPATETSSNHHSSAPSRSQGTSSPSPTRWRQRLDRSRSREGAAIVPTMLAAGIPAAVPSSSRPFHSRSQSATSNTARQLTARTQPPGNPMMRMANHRSRNAWGSSKSQHESDPGPSTPSSRGATHDETSASSASSERQRSSKSGNGTRSSGGSGTWNRIVTTLFNSPPSSGVPQRGRQAPPQTAHDPTSPSEDPFASPPPPARPSSALQPMTASTSNAEFGLGGEQPEIVSRSASMLGKSRSQSSLHYAYSHTGPAHLEQRKGKGKGKAAWLSSEADEACFVDSSGPCSALGTPSVPLHQGRDFMPLLPTEVALYILLLLGFEDVASLTSCASVSRLWRVLARDGAVWRELFLRRPGWAVKDIHSSRNQDEQDPVLERATQESRRPASPPPPVFPSRRAGGTLRSRQATHTAETMGQVAGIGIESPSPRLSRRFSNLLNNLGSLTVSSLGPADGASATPDAPPLSSPVPSEVPPDDLQVSVISSAVSPSGPSVSRRSSASILTAPATPKMMSPMSSSLQGDVISIGSSEASIYSEPAIDWYKTFRDRWVLDERWSQGKQKRKLFRGHRDSVYCLQFDRHKIITGSRDTTVKIWNAKTGFCVRTLQAHAGSVLCLRYDSQALLTGSSDCSVFMWSLTTFDVVRRLVGHTAGVLDIAFDNRHIVSCSKDTNIKIWSRADGTCQRTLHGHRGPVNAVQLRGNLLLSASGDSFMKLWNINTGEVVRKFEGHKRGLACVQWADDHVVSGSNDETIKIWNLHTGECLGTFEGHTGLVRTVALDVAANRLVSGSYDNTVKVWNFETRQCLLDFRKNKSLVFDVQLDCSRIMSVGYDSNVTVVRILPGSSTASEATRTDRIQTGGTVA